MRALVAVVLLLASCGAPDDEGVESVTPGEAAALNDAAAMLDENAVVANEAAR